MKKRSVDCVRRDWEELAGDWRSRGELTRWLERTAKGK